MMASATNQIPWKSLMYQGISTLISASLTNYGSGAGYMFDPSRQDSYIYLLNQLFVYSNTNTQFAPLAAPLEQLAVSIMTPMGSAAQNIQTIQGLLADPAGLCHGDTTGFCTTMQAVMNVANDVNSVTNSFTNEDSATAALTALGSLATDLTSLSTALSSKPTFLSSGAKELNDGVTALSGALTTYSAFFAGINTCLKSCLDTASTISKKLLGYTTKLAASASDMATTNGVSANDQCTDAATSCAASCSNVVITAQAIIDKGKQYTKPAPPPAAAAKTGVPPADAGQQTIESPPPPTPPTPAGYLGNLMPPIMIAMAGQNLLCAVNNAIFTVKTILATSSKVPTADDVNKLTQALTTAIEGVVNVVEPSMKSPQSADSNVAGLTDIVKIVSYGSKAVLSFVNGLSVAAINALATTSPTPVI
jgi:hypothetical protein